MIPRPMLEDAGNTEDATEYKFFIKFSVTGDHYLSINTNGFDQNSQSDVGGGKVFLSNTNKPGHNETFVFGKSSNKTSVQLGIIYNILSYIVRKTDQNGRAYYGIKNFKHGHYLRL